MRISPDIQMKLKESGFNGENPQVDVNVERPIHEYPFMETRLKDIDYKAIIAEGKPWKDPYFKADSSTILDPTMMRPPNKKQWETFTWRRASEVLGEGNYKVF
jgi:hypothetical protein